MKPDHIIWLVTAAYVFLTALVVFGIIHFSPVALEK
jgi:hypothetical protein